MASQPDLSKDDGGAHGRPAARVRPTRGKPPRAANDNPTNRTKLSVPTLVAIAGIAAIGLLLLLG